MIRKTLAFFKFLKQEREKFNSICEELDEITNELKESRRLQSIEFYEEVKNDRRWAFSLKRFELSQGRITQKEYDEFEKKVNSVITAIESGIIPKEDFFELCFMRNK